MALELGKAFSFFASILSLCALMQSAFFIPATTWQDRLSASLLHIAFAACICFASGILFREDALRHTESEPPLTATLPVRLFLWSLFGMGLLFLLSWFLVTYYIPQIWKNQPW
jgi:hypothetical protein